MALANCKNEKPSKEAGLKVRVVALEISPEQMREIGPRPRKKSPRVASRAMQQKYSPKKENDP